MANYRELLMNIIFFGEAYVKATKRKEDEKAKKYHNALIASERELKLEMAKADQKRAETTEKRRQREEEKATRKERAQQVGRTALRETSDPLEALRVQQDAMRDMLPLQTTSPMGARTGPLGQVGGRTAIPRMPGEPKTDEGPYQRTDLRLRGQMPQDTSAIDQLRRGDGQRLQLAGPRFPRPSERRERRPGMAQRRVRTETPALETEEPRFPRPSEQVERRESKFLAPGLNRVETVINDAKEMNRIGQGGTVAIDTSPDKTLIKGIIEATTEVPTESLGEAKNKATQSRIYNSPKYRQEVDKVMTTFGFLNRRDAEVHVANMVESIYRGMGYEGFIFPGSSEDLSKRKEIRKFEDGSTIVYDNVTGKIETLDPSISIGDKTVDWDLFEKIQLATGKAIPAKNPDSNELWILNDLMDHVGVLENKITPQDKGKWTTVGGVFTDGNYNASIYQVNNVTGDSKKVSLGKQYPEISWDQLKDLREMYPDIRWNDTFETISIRYPDAIMMLPADDDASPLWDKQLTFKITVDEDGTPNQHGEWTQMVSLGVNYDTGKLDQTPLPNTIFPRVGTIFSPEDQNDKAASIHKAMNMDATYKQYHTISAQFKIMEAAYADFADNLTQSNLFDDSDPENPQLKGFRSNVELIKVPKQVWNKKEGSYRTVMVDQYKPTDDALRNGRLNAASQALIMAFNKILDYASVVRESEFNRTAQSMGIFDKIAGLKNKWLKGGPGLTMAEVQSFYSLAGKIDGIFEDRYTKGMTPYLARTLMLDKRLSKGSDESLFIEASLGREILNQFGLTGKVTFKDLRKRYNTFTLATPLSENEEDLDESVRLDLQFGQ